MLGEGPSVGSDRLGLIGQAWICSQEQQERAGVVIWRAEPVHMDPELSSGRLDTHSPTRVGEERPFINRRPKHRGGRPAAPTARPLLDATCRGTIKERPGAVRWDHVSILRPPYRGATA